MVSFPMNCLFQRNYCYILVYTLKDQGPHRDRDRERDITRSWTLRTDSPCYEHSTRGVRKGKGKVV